MKRFKYYKPFIIISLLIILNSSGCSEEPPVVPPPPPPVQKDSIVISIADVTHRSVSVSFQSAVVSPQSTTVKLFREFSSTNSLIAELPGVVTDTTIIDDDNGTGLQLDKTYSYYAVSIDSTGNVKDTSNTVTAKTLAPTTHNYTWTEYTIGEWQSALYDVWGTDENNVWACGGVKINDTTYGVLKWNGIEWKPEKRIGGLKAIYGFSKTDIWTVGGGVWHYDGNEWTSLTEQYPVFIDNIPYTSIWGTSSSNLYLGNQWGKIIHWDGQKATLLSELSVYPITSIYGVASNNIYITASRATGVNPAELYHYDGNIFTLVITGNNNPGVGELRGPFTKIWQYENQELYISGNNIKKRVNDKWEEKFLHFFTSDVDGTKPNNVFVSGDFGGLAHYNGVEWYEYDNVFNPFAVLRSVQVFEDKVFIVGFDGVKAFIYIGSK